MCRAKFEALNPGWEYALKLDTSTRRVSYVNSTVQSKYLAWLGEYGPTRVWVHHNKFFAVPASEEDMDAILNSLRGDAYVAVQLYKNFLESRNATYEVPDGT